MLQRAASNAYSWWWASHIRTKQSKWMEQNLLDMEEKVQNVLRLIEEDGDSFARRAEMYYKKRPELINFVEESYRAYRSLAERYDHISTELQNANNTIASVFPEQVQFSMDEEDEEAMPKLTRKPPEISKANIPKVPKAPIDLKTVITTATKKLKSKKNAKMAAAASLASKSGLSKQEALHEIDKLQKQILALQTEKEFLKSSYESGLAKYWEIENQIKEMQDRVSNLQDEYGEGMVIEDDEARNVMAKAALKSCQESLAQLQEKQERSAEEARLESTRIREVRERLESLKGELHSDESGPEKSFAKNEPVRRKEVPNQLNKEVDSAVDEKQREDELRQQIKEQLEASTCLTMTEMAEKIDELVNKVISLETALSSQTALIKQLRSETDELQTQIQTLEDDKASIIDGKNNLQQKLKEMEEKLGGIQDLNQKVENEKSNFETQIIEVHCNLAHLSDKLPSVQQDEEPEPKSSLTTEPEKLPNVNLGASGLKSSLTTTELEQPKKLPNVNLGASGLKSSFTTAELQQLEKLPNVNLSASGLKSSLTTAELEQPEKLPNVNLCASGLKSSLTTAELEQPEKLTNVNRGASGLKSSLTTVELEQPEKLPNVKLDASGLESSLTTVEFEQPEKLPNVKLGASGLESSLTTMELEQPEKLPNVNLGASGLKSSLTIAELEQSEKLPNVKLGASEPHTELKQPDKKLKAHEGSDDPKQMRADEACQVTDLRRNEEPAIEMKSSMLQYPKEEESENFKGISETADASGMNRNQENIGQTQVDSPNLESNSKKLDVYATSRSLVEVVNTQDKSESSTGSYEKFDTDDAAKSGEEIIQTLSVDIEGNPKKNDAYGSPRNPIEIVQTKANSQYAQGGCEEASLNATSRSLVEVVQTQDKLQNSKGSFEKSDADNTARIREGVVLALSVNTEANPEKFGSNGSAGNPVEVVQTKANSGYSEGGVNGTLTSQVEEIHKQTNLGQASGKTEDVMKEQNKEEKKTSSEAIGAEQEKQLVNKEDEPNWQQLFLNGIEDREKVLLTEYTTTLRNFKDVKKKLNEMDEKNRDRVLQTSKQLSDLKTSNALKDQEIRSLRHKLNLMQKCFYESKESMDLSAESINFSASDHQKTSSTSEDQNIKLKITTDDSARSETLTPQISHEDQDFDISKLLVQQPATTSAIEERLRMKIDELLEENLDFWLKFSTSFHQIQKFETGIQDLKSEVTKLQEKGKKLDESGSGKYSLKSEARPLYKHLREIQTELTVWSDKSAALKEELQSRFSSLCKIQEDITAGLKASAEDDDFTFTSYQAAKFQGEVLNMKQENNKVADELQAALDRIASLQLDVETTLTKLNEEFRLSGSKKQETPQLRHSESRNRVPLRSFIFGVKPKKQKQSIFSGMAPVMQKKYYALRAGTPL